MDCISQLPLFIFALTVNNTGLILFITLGGYRFTGSHLLHSIEWFVQTANATIQTANLIVFTCLGHLTMTNDYVQAIKNRLNSGRYQFKFVFIVRMSKNKTIPNPKLKRCSFPKGDFTYSCPSSCSEWIHFNTFLLNDPSSQSVRYHTSEHAISCAPHTFPSRE